MAHNLITENELTYYVDGQLPPARQIEVEAYLANEPELAARIMDELKINHELRLMNEGSDIAPSAATGNLARRLQRSMARRSLLRRLRPGMAACLLVALGAVGGGVLTNAMSEPDLPDYVEAAFQAHAVSQVRAVMVSQLEAPEYDRDELLSATAIEMPTLPPDWVVTDVQVYPSRFGPSVEMAIDAASLGRVSIFAARPGNSTEIEPATAEHSGVTFGHWQMGDIAYVLVGRAGPPDILLAAQDLAHSLY